MKEFHPRFATGAQTERAGQVMTSRGISAQNLVLNDGGNLADVVERLYIVELALVDY